MPIRTPVKLPGPAATATASISCGVRSQPVIMFFASSISVLLCVWPEFCVYSASRQPSDSNAALAAFAEDSKASKFKAASSFDGNVAGIRHKGVFFNRDADRVLQRVFDIFAPLDGAHAAPCKIILPADVE